MAGRSIDRSPRTVLTVGLSRGRALGTGGGDRTPLADPPLRHLLFGGRVGVADRRRQLRAAALAFWLGGPLLAMRACGRLGQRRALHRIARWWGRGLARHLGMRVEVTGLDRIDPGERYIVAPLHEGFADALALLHLPLDLCFVARDELFGWPIVGPFLRDTGQLEVCPEDGASGLRRLRRAAEAVFAADEHLVAFPQGSILGIEIACRTGPFVLARLTGRPILPVVLTGGHRVWEYPFTPRLRFGQRVSLRVLAPISAAEVRATDARRLRADVERRLKAVALSGGVAPPRRYVPARDGYWDGYSFDIDPAFPELAAEIAARRARP